MAGAAEAISLLRRKQEQAVGGGRGKRRSGQRGARSRTFFFESGFGTDSKVSSESWADLRVSSQVQTDLS
eukprot:3073457-Prymnesium_polylepis.1